ncbi:MAG: 2-dehydropantoate 2-reductase [Betaproteobacteria bacterium]|nr:2-dehydropantoate 2-reductase [Betaproteobacteria bacterium]
MKPQMRIAIMGAGGVGGYYGGRLAQAGHDVTFITRGEHLRAIQEKGLSLAGPGGDSVVTGAKATADPGRIEPVDVVLFCVKLFDTEEAARAIQPLLSKGGVCITLQNGVDGQQRIAAVVGDDRVIGGIAFVSALIESPGVIRYSSKAPSIKFGEADGRMSERAVRFRDACKAAGIDAEVVADIRSALWHKFVGLAVNAALTSLVRKPAGVCYHDPDLLALARSGFEEGAAVARAMGIQLPGDIAEWQVQNHRKFPPQMYASMYHDLARGRRLELDSLSGLIVRKGRELGVPTPFHSMAYACLKPYLNGSPVSE